ncbi:MAG: hypothetical protein HC840_00925 [Leptolyngbyaceae cyanobacterium RM2_2_4]|nr:hypothetical protein [Leptolyngbyaceae cyanobacterium RM2_2_4]
MKQKPGYHLKEIKKGQPGELSKIQEELDEAFDAEDQGVKIMLAVELSDLIGAVEQYAEQSFLYMANQGMLPPGKYQAVSPCFRDEVQGPGRRKFFMKTSLSIRKSQTETL